MKKSFESGKIWTFLSAFIFMMMCGLFVLAVNTLPSSKAGTWFNDYTTESLKQTSYEPGQAILTAEHWDKIMSGLNDMIIPHGAIMAFELETCPNGWSPYNKANNRFLMGADNNIGTTSGRSEVKLSIDNLPPHTHTYYDTVFAESSLNKLPDGKWKDYLYLGIYDYGPVIGSASTDSDNKLVQARRSTSRHVCSDEGKFLKSAGDANCVLLQEPIEIINPYVKVKYCIKD